jgi:hypothetical protein
LNYAIYLERAMDKLMHYLDAQITIKGNMITRMSQYFQIESLSNQEPPPIFPNHRWPKMKRYYAHGLTHTTSKSLMENGGEDNKR